MADLSKPSANFDAWTNADPRPLLYVIAHSSGGHAATNLPRLTQAQPNGPSVHRYVQHDGTRYQLVQDKDMARAVTVDAAHQRPDTPMAPAWRGKENTVALHFEVEGLDTDPITDAQYAAAADWTAESVRAYGIPFDRHHIIGHRELTTAPDQQDPNAGWDWDRFMGLVRARLQAAPPHVDYFVLGPPTISRQKYHDLLVSHHSPVAPTADAAYDTCLHYGVNPVVPLAFFAKESVMGSQFAPEAQGLRDAHNWGNLVHVFNPARNTGRTVHAFGHDFPVYNTWVDGLADYCERLLDPNGPYAGEGRTTVRSIIPRYAPPSENNTALYIQQVVGWCTLWSDVTPAPPPPPTPADFPVVGPPTISRAVFAQVLQAGPAAAEADACYTACTSAGVNPAVPLVLFGAISQYGTHLPAGITAAMHNWAGLYAPPNYSSPNTYSSWAEGLRDWCTRATTHGWTTVSALAPRFTFPAGITAEQAAAQMNAQLKAWKTAFDQSSAPRDLAPPADSAGRDLMPPQPAAPPDLTATLTACENEWMGAWQRRDGAACARILAAEFTLTSTRSSGDLFNKTQWLEQALGPLVCHDFGFDRVQVRRYGDVALVNALYHQQATAHGQDWSGVFLLTDVWVWRDGRWQVVTRHASRPAAAG